VGYHEIMGHRRRYRLLDLDRLYWRMATDDAEEVRRNLEAALSDAIDRGEVKREPIWTESLAVGSAGFVEKSRPMVLSRRETEVIEIENGVTVLQEAQEAPFPYGQETSSKSDRRVVLWEFCAFGADSEPQSAVKSTTLISIWAMHFTVGVFRAERRFVTGLGDPINRGRAGLSLLVARIKRNCSQ